jgi:hypothetical protein
MMSNKTAKANVEPVRQRTQYSCMAASMAMCLRALDHDVTEDEVNRVMGARPMKGAAWEQALATAQHYGCRATLTMPATVEQLKAWTDAGVPVMIAWNPEGRDWSHASVVFDVDDDLNVYVADPNLPNPKKTVRTVTEDDFYGKWYEKFPDYLVRRPACAIEREVTTEGKQVNILAVEEAQPTAVKLLASRTAAQKDTPTQAAIWRAWDTLQGVEKVREGDSFESVAQSFFLTLSIEEVLNGTKYGRAADKMYRKLPGIEKQTRSWRAGYNLWREGKPIDMGRMASDMGKTLASVEKVQNALVGMTGIKREFPAVWAEIMSEFGSALRATNRAVEALNSAIAMLKSGKAAGAEVMAGKKERNRSKDRAMSQRLKGQKPKGPKPKRTPDQQARAQAEWKARKEEGRAGLPGAGAAGKHRNKQDHARGHKRRPKHRGRQAVENVARAFVRMASIRGDEFYFLATDGNWYLEYEHYPFSDDDDDDYAESQTDYYGPFDSEKAAHKYQERHLSNTGGFSSDSSGRMKPPRKPISPRGRRWAAYSGNPDGKPIYPVEVDHGDNQALSGGFDVMKRLQDRYRIEQGHQPREQNPRLAAQRVEAYLFAEANWRNNADSDHRVVANFTVPGASVREAVEAVFKKGQNNLKYDKAGKKLSLFPNPDWQMDAKGFHLTKTVEEHQAVSHGIDAWHEEYTLRIRLEVKGSTSDMSLGLAKSMLLWIRTGRAPKRVPRRAADAPEMQLNGRRVKVNDAFLDQIKKAYPQHTRRSGNGGWSLIHPDSDKPLARDQDVTDFEFYFFPSRVSGWWSVSYQPGYLILLQKAGDKMRAKTTRLARSSSDTSAQVEALR